MVANRQEEKQSTFENQSTRFSADVQLEHGFVQTANDLFEALFIAGLSQRKRQIIDCIIRYSWGCNKRKYCHLTPPEIDDLTGIDKADVYDILHDLKRRCIIKWDLRTHKLSFQKDYGKWIVSEKVYRKLKRIGGGLYKEMARKQLQGEVSVGKSPTKIESVGKSPTGGVGKLPKREWVNHLQPEAVDPQPQQISGVSKERFKEIHKENDDDGSSNETNSKNEDKQLEDAFRKDPIILIKEYLKNCLISKNPETQRQLIADLIQFRKNPVVKSEKLLWIESMFGLALQKIISRVHEGKNTPFKDYGYLKITYCSIVKKDKLPLELTVGIGTCPECGEESVRNLNIQGDRQMYCPSCKWGSRFFTDREFEGTRRRCQKEYPDYLLKAEEEEMQRLVEYTRKSLERAEEGS